MPSPTPKRGSGEKLTEIDLGELGTLVVYDDGDTDEYLRVEINGKEDLITWFVGVWADMGDDAFIEALEKLAVDDDDGIPLTQSHNVAFKCDGDCNQTWPNTRNQNPGSGPDLCPNCADD